VCPSAPPLGIALGPTNPSPIVVAKETLGFRWWRFSLHLRLLMPTFSLPSAPKALAGPSSLHWRRSPTTRKPNFGPNIFDVGRFFPWRGEAGLSLGRNLPMRLRPILAPFSPYSRKNPKFGFRIRSFGNTFSPGISSAQKLLTSELLRTL
jgi:hypothetical protein